MAREGARALVAHPFYIHFAGRGHVNVNVVMRRAQ